MFEAKWYMGNDAVRTLEEENIKTVPSDFYAVHVFVRKKDDLSMMAIGTACPDEKTGDIRIERIVLSEAYRGTIFDELVLRMILFKFQELPNKKIYMWAKDEQQKLLARFGFSSNGEKNTVCCETLLKMSVNTNSIIWPSECKC